MGDGYCLNKTKKRMLHVVYGILALLAAVDCLRLHAPAAIFQEYGGFSKYKSMGQQEWANVERSFQQRKEQIEKNG